MREIVVERSHVHVVERAGLHSEMKCRAALCVELIIHLCHDEGSVVTVSLADEQKTLSVRDSSLCKRMRLVNPSDDHLFKSVRFDKEKRIALMSRKHLSRIIDCQNPVVDLQDAVAVVKRLEVQILRSRLNPEA